MKKIPANETRFALEARLEREFLTKWSTKELEATYGSYWTSTPSCLYWCLIYYSGSGPYAVDQQQLSRDFAAIYRDTSPTRTNSSIQHARRILKALDR